MKPEEEICIACTYSGSDEAMYCYYGCPSCTCPKEEDYTPDNSHEAYVDFNQWEPTEE